MRDTETGTKTEERNSGLLKTESAHEEELRQRKRVTEIKSCCKRERDRERE